MRRPYSPAYYYCHNNVNIAENCLWCELSHCIAGNMKCSLAIARVQIMVSKQVLHTGVNLGSQATKWAQ